MLACIENRQICLELQRTEVDWGGGKSYWHGRKQWNREKRKPRAGKLSEENPCARPLWRESPPSAKLLGRASLGRASRNPQHADGSDWKYESSAPRMTHGCTPPPWAANENTDEEEGRAEDSTISQGISQPYTMSTLMSWIFSRSAVGGWGGDRSDHVGKERGVPSSLTLPARAGDVLKTEVSTWETEKGQLVLSS